MNTVFQMSEFDLCFAKSRKWSGDTERKTCCWVPEEKLRMLSKVQTLSSLSLTKPRGLEWSLYKANTRCQAVIYAVWLLAAIHQKLKYFTKLRYSFEIRIESKV